VEIIVGGHCLGRAEDIIHPLGGKSEGDQGLCSWVLEQYILLNVGLESSRELVSKCSTIHRGLDEVSDGRELVNVIADRLGLHQGIETISCQVGGVRGQEFVKRAAVNSVHVTPQAYWAQGWLLVGLHNRVCLGRLGVLLVTAL
jgi:hypothetical protein